MEVSGKRAVKTFSASFTNTSAEGFDFYCEPCDSEGKHVEAHGYCKNCQEFLCEACLTSHRRVRLTKNHILLDSDKMPKVQKPRQRDTDCSEKCLQHPKEIIIYYCKGHDEVGCHECMSAMHSACVNEYIEYIPEISSGIKDSPEYKNMLKEIDNLENEARKLEKKAKGSKEISDQCYNAAVKDIESFSQDIHDQLDKIVKDLLNDADEEKEKVKSEMNETLANCGDAMRVVNNIKDEIKTTVVSQSNAFVIMKLNKKQLEKCEKTISKCMSVMTPTFKFKPNGDVRDFLKTKKVVGELTYSVTEDVRTEAKLQTKVIARLCRKLNVKSKTDTNCCDIVDIDMLSSQEMVLADFSNLCLKVFNMAEQRVTDRLNVFPQPLGVTVLTKDTIAATTRLDILIICNSGKLKLKSKIRLESQCTGIRRLQSHLASLSNYPFPKIQVLSCEGAVMKIMLSDSEIKTLKYPQHIALSADGKYVYISDYSSNNKITRLSMFGEVVNVYQNTDEKDFIKQPRGIAVANDGSLYVCDFFGDKIRKLSADLSSNTTILSESDGIKKPQSVYLCKSDNRLFISCRHSDEILVFNMSAFC